jgi:hypothetical protein
MKRLRGLQILEEPRSGGARSSTRRPRCLYSRTFLNKDEEVRIQERQIRSLPIGVLRVVGNAILLEHTTRLGSRQAVAGVEHMLIGMKVASYRKVSLSLPLAHHDKDVPGFIPADAG